MNIIMTQLSRIAYSENEFDQFPCGWLKETYSK